MWTFRVNNIHKWIPLCKFENQNLIRTRTMRSISFLLMYILHKDLYQLPSKFLFLYLLHHARRTNAFQQVTVALSRVPAVIDAAVPISNAGWSELWDATWRLIFIASECSLIYVIWPRVHCCCDLELKFKIFLWSWISARIATRTIF